MRYITAGSFMFLIATTAQSQASLEQPVSTPVYGPAASDQFGPAVASNGTDFLVAWLDGRAWQSAIYANRVTEDGVVLDSTGIRIPLQSSTNANILGAFWIGGAYTLVYSYQDFGIANAPWFTAVARISADGQLIDARHAVLEGFFGLAAASNGSRIVVLSGNGIAVLDEHAELLDRDVPLPTGAAYGVGVASNSSTFLVSSFSYDGLSNWLNFVALDANGHATASTRFSGGGIGKPLVVSDRVDYLVLYRGANGVVAQQVTPAATVATSSKLPEDLLPSSAIWVGDAYMLATSINDQGQQIAVARLRRDGTVISAPQPVGAPGTPGAMAFNGTESLISWTTGSQSSPDAVDVAGMLISRNGHPLSAAMTIPTSSNPQRGPAIATGGRNDLVVWNEASGIYAARVSRSGAALDGRGIRISTESTGTRDLVYGSPRPLRVTLDGDAYLVAWVNRAGALIGQGIDGETGALLGSPVTLATCVKSFDLGHDDSGLVVFAADCSDLHLFAERVTTAGPLGVPVRISPLEMLTSAPRAAWDGHQWLVAWNELIFITNIGTTPVYRANVYAQRVSSTLNVIDVSPMAIEVSRNHAATPLVASDGRDFLVVWSRMWNDASGSGAGVFARHITSGGALGDGAAPPGILVAPGRSAAVAAVWDGSRYAIEYATLRDDMTYNLRLTHVASTGDVAAGDRIAVSPADTDTPEGDLVVVAPGRVRATYARTAAESAYGGVARVFTRDNVAVRQRAARPR